MLPKNENVLKEVFDKNKKFDIILSSFALHYLVATPVFVDNFTQNVNNHIDQNGYLVATLFDGDKILELLGSNNVYTSYYLDEDNVKTKLFEIKKIDNSDNDIQEIDVHMAWISDAGVYIREPIVKRKYLEDIFREKCNMRLIEHDYFYNSYLKNNDFFNIITPNEENEKMKKFFDNVNKYYGDLKGADKESFTFMKINAFYIFQKM